jgi:DNA polymerase-1
VTTHTLELFVESGKLRYRVRRGTPSPELLHFLSSHKQELVSLLTPTAEIPPDAGQNGQIGQNGPAAPGDDWWADDSVQSVHSVHERQGDRRRGEKPPPYLLVSDASVLPTVEAALDNTVLIGLDVETTGLDPRSHRIRLLSLACDTIDGVSFSYLIDCFAVDPAPLFAALAGKELVVHNASFDLGFLARLGFIPAGRIRDTMLLSRLLTAGGPDWHKNGLAACALRELNLTLDKSHQKDDWSRNLTDDQLVYAARDVAVLRPLFTALSKKIVESKLERAVEIETRAIPAFLWLARSSVAFDGQAWQRLTGEADHLAKDLADRLTALAPARPGYLIGESAWDWNSPVQVKQVFEAMGFKLDSTDDEALAGVDHPLAGLLREYRGVSRRISTYGDWSHFVSADGRIYAEWNQLGSVAGRTSCADPNLQQVPRDPRYRRCFIAPPGRVLVKADYSQLQLRIAAKVAADKAMLAAYARGDDLHTLTARQLTGKTEVTQADRQLAKAVNFGLLFGLGARGLRAYAKSNYELELSEAEAKHYRRAFFAAYPGLGWWHKRAGTSRAKECRTLAARRRLLDEKTPYTHRLNTPVQGTEADGAKLAMALLWERRHECPGAFPVLFVHDELVVECNAAQADAVATWVKQAMLDGMAPLIDPVPVEVEVKVRQTWGGD